MKFLKKVFNCLKLFILFSFLLNAYCVDKSFNKLKEYPYNPSYCKSNKDSVLNIAERELVRVYGEGVLRQRPFVPYLDTLNNTWLVSGTLKVKKDSLTGLLLTQGGVASIKLSALNCKVLSFNHGL